MKAELTNEISKHRDSLLEGYLPALVSTLDPFLASYPQWRIAIYGAIGLYGYYMSLKGSDVLEYIKFIKLHPDKFRKEIVQSQEFNEGFVVAFQEYLKLRVEEKKHIAKNIILGFAITEDKENFPLERIHDILLKISVPTLISLIFIKEKIISKKEKITLYGAINKWYFENEEENKWKYKEICLAVEEFIGLGGIAVNLAGPEGGFSVTGGSVYDLTLIGTQFLTYLDFQEIE